eukprot:TRINITY_DN1674_c0_g1_i3.p1 TRINITY_DN1674_c0_g1~~TRINITY_DN1674_c0_g1_i3.p1  ORF type:complete len:306 (-),score=50.49 TRINITY_DN1674_c0_g1_i3:112-1029(-)
MCIRDRYQRRVHGKIKMRNEVARSIFLSPQYSKERLDPMINQYFEEGKKKDIALAGSLSVCNINSAAAGMAQPKDRYHKEDEQTNFLRKSVPYPKMFSSYEKDFKSRPLDLLGILKKEKELNSEKMHKETYHAKSIVKNSTYKDNYLPNEVFMVNRRKAEAEFNDHPLNSRKLSPSTGLPFVGASSYGSSFFDIGRDPLPYVSGGNKKIYTLPFKGKSLYQENFHKSPKLEKVDKILPLSHFNVSHPFVGESTSKKSYTIPKVTIPCPRALTKRELVNTFFISWIVSINCQTRFCGKNGETVISD